MMLITHLYKREKPRLQSVGAAFRVLHNTKIERANVGKPY